MEKYFCTFFEKCKIFLTSGKRKILPSKSKCAMEKYFLHWKFIFAYFQELKIFPKNQIVHCVLGKSALMTNVRKA